MKSLDVLLLYNQPTLRPDDPDWASEAGVLESVEAVSAALRARGHAVRPFAAAEPAEQLVRDLTNLAPPDVVFNLFEGLGGVGRGEAEIAGLAELCDWPLTGSPARCLELVRDKARTKWLLAGAGVPTAAFVLLAAEESIESARLEPLLEQGPVIVKPAHEDASLGIGINSVVGDMASLCEQIESVRARYGAVLVERFIVGREFNVALVELPNLETLPLAEIEFAGEHRPGWGIVTYEAKWAAGSAADRATPARCPATVDAPTAERIRQIARTAFRLTGCRHYARVDLRLDEAGTPHVLEVNGNPDIGPTAGFARALGVAGIAYEEFVDRLVRTPAARG